MYRKLENRIIEYRRQLHKIPELGFELPKTRAFLLSVLAPLGFEIRDLGKAGFTAYFDNNKKQTIAFRSDMDAIPIQESGACSFASVHEGVMHACGHDGHMSILLGLAILIAENPEKSAYNCLLVFEAAEETTGGAKLICDTGILKDYGVLCIYGLHLWPYSPLHTIVCRPGEFMAGTYVIEVTAKGRSAHIAEYQESADALEAGCKFIMRAYELERTLPPEKFRILRFGEIVSGTANNIISGKTYMAGAVRAFDDDTFSYFLTGLEKIMRELETETGVAFTFEKSDGYPPVINPPDLYAQTKATLTNADFEWHTPEYPTMHAEDFVFYQREVPGLFMHLGTGAGVLLHSPEYKLDEMALLTGTRLFWTLLTTAKEWE